MSRRGARVWGSPRWGCGRAAGESVVLEGRSSWPGGGRGGEGSCSGPVPVPSSQGPRHTPRDKVRLRRGFRMHFSSCWGRHGTSRQSHWSRPRRAWCEEAAELWAWLTSPPGAAAGRWVLGRGGPLTGAGRAGTTFNPLLPPGPLQPCQHPYSRPFLQPYLLPCSFPELTGLAWGCLVWPERHWGGGLSRAS